MKKYEFNKKLGIITHTKSGRKLYYFPPIGSMSGEVIRERENGTTVIVWQREQGNKFEGDSGIWTWEDLMDDNRLDELFFGEAE